MISANSKTVNLERVIPDDLPAVAGFLLQPSFKPGINPHKHVSPSLLCTEERKTISIYVYKQGLR